MLEEDYEYEKSLEMCSIVSYSKVCFHSWIKLIGLLGRSTTWTTIF
jgi:hypothetical protein